MMSLLFILFLAVMIQPLANREKLSIILFCEWIRFDALCTGKIMCFSHRLILVARCAQVVAARNRSRIVPAGATAIGCNASGSKCRPSVVPGLTT
jgi:hypothetical protein